MKKIDYLEEIKNLLNTLPYELKIEFALFCAKEARQYADKKDLIVIDAAINLTYRHLKGEAVTNAELSAAANAANAAAYAAYEAANAANAAANAANSEAYVDKLKIYYKYLKTLINNLSSLEQIIYGLV